jgi:hypothetical protein
MLYAKLFRVTGDMLNSLAIYKRALFIHMINFRANQMELQLAELNVRIKELESSNASRLPVSSEIPIPIESDIGKPNIIICSSFSRCCDEYAFCIAASLKQMGSMNLIGVVAGGQPQHERSQFARRALDALLLSEVPVAFSKTAPPAASGSRASPYISCDGVEMITRLLTEATDTKSITLICDSCPNDIAEVIAKHPAMFAEKIEKIVILGSVQSPRWRGNIEPTSTDDERYDQALSQVYAACQQFNVPTISLSNDAARGFPFSATVVDNLTQTNHMISSEVQRKEVAQTRRLWEEGTKESRKYIFGNEKPKTGQHNVWQLVKSINTELLLGLLCCIPAYREAHFRFDTHVVNGVDHLVCRQQNSKASVQKIQGLSDEIIMLVGFALRAALLNTSC